MFDRGACDHRIEEQRPGRKIDNGRAGDAEWVDVAAWQTGSDRRADRALPNHVASASVKRIHSVRFSRDNDHRRTVGTILNIKWLAIHAARNRPVEVQIPPQIRSGRSRESRIDVKPRREIYGCAPA